MAELTQEELNERVAVLRRFRTLLEEQRNKFQEYLLVLEKQQDSITNEDTEKLIAHTELEQQVVKNIANLQKVIIPMSKLYNSANIPHDSVENDSINKIQAELNVLQEKVLHQNQINRDLLRVHIGQIQAQIQNFKNPYRNARSVYAPKQPVATMVHVEV